MATITGTSGDDLNLDGTSGNDPIDAGLGSNVIERGHDHDALLAGRKNAGDMGSLLYAEGAVTERVAPVGKLIDPGTLAFSGADATGTYVAASAIVAPAGALGSLPGDVTGPMPVVDGAGTWNDGVAVNAVESQAAGQQKGGRLTIAIDDGIGATVGRTIGVMAEGANEAPITVPQGGTVTTDFFNNIGAAVALQADGKIVAAGSSQNSSDFALARYNVDGSLDTTFGGGDGKVTTNFFDNTDGGYSVTLQPTARSS
jgi:uncharacterized delta-60 repeat protein